MTVHRCKYKANKEGTKKYNFTSFQLFDKYGVDNCKIILIENVCAKSKDELIARETYYIRNMKCVNCRIEDRTEQEYYQDNIEKIKEYKRNYHIKNKENICEKTMKYYNDNREEINEKRRLVYESNKDYKRQEKIKFYHDTKTIVECACGSKIIQHHLNIHLNTAKHKNYLITINSQSKTPVTAIWV